MSKQTEKTMNALQRLHPEFGQSIWFDFISKKLLESGELARLAKSGEVRGVTSNPSIFEKAVGEGVEYGPALAALRKEKPKASAFEIYETLAVRDIQAACDVMKGVYDQSQARDGYVSLEVTMQKGERAIDILDEARRLWVAVGRPNVMIKVPATTDGIVAFEELIAEGVNVNVTLLFAVDTYVRVAKAYVAGLEKRSKKNGNLAKVASVASFFVSRIDTVIDKQLEGALATAKNDKERNEIRALMGKAAIANAKLAYAEYGKVFSGKKWEALAKKGAQTQRVLWASTGTKNKAYSDVMYVEELIGRETVNTAPPATIDAFRDHGKPRASLADGLADAQKTMGALADHGVSMTRVTDALLVDGLKQFADAFVKLLATVAGNAAGAAAGPSTPAAFASAPSAKSASANTPPASTAGKSAAPAPAIPAPKPTSSKSGGASTVGTAPASTGFAAFSFVAPKDVTAATQAVVADWKQNGKVARLWSRDASLWSNADEAKWLGWLDATTSAKNAVADLTAFAAEVRQEGFTHVLLLGMGGSSLCPDVLRHTFGSKKPNPTLEVLDSTDPAQVAAVEKKVDLSKTLFVVASKSGSTLEPNIMEQYFWERAVKTVGANVAGSRFVAITDPGSKLEGVAKAKKYRRIFAGVPSIGGRFSALSNFGLVPAAAIGLDLARFTARAHEMAEACGPNSAADANPGVQLGAWMGAAAKSGRDKLTLVVSPALSSLGGWLEQLVAESTGKIGKGIVPVDLEPVAAPNAYGNDRLFVYVRFEGAADAAQDAAIEALEKAGHVVARLRVADALDLGAEFFRWEIATAVAGAVLGLNPFDQPDVEASKIVTKELTSAYEATGSLPAEKPFFEESGVRLYADAKHAQRLFKATGPQGTLADVVRAHLDTAKAGDYVAILAYLDMNAAHQAELAAARVQIRDARRLATCLEFGPRFLHSTGQAYKGGPNSGVFLQITCDDAADLQVPGAKYTFGVVKAAQARGDFAVLVERGRRALRVHLGRDTKAGIATLRAALNEALDKPAQAAR